METKHTPVFDVEYDGNTFELLGPVKPHRTGGTMRDVISRFEDESHALEVCNGMNEEFADLAAQVAALKEEVGLLNIHNNNNTELLLACEAQLEERGKGIATLTAQRDELLSTTKKARGRIFNLLCNVKWYATGMAASESEQREHAEQSNGIREIDAAIAKAEGK